MTTQIQRKSQVNSNKKAKVQNTLTHLTQIACAHTNSFKH